MKRVYPIAVCVCLMAVAVAAQEPKPERNLVIDINVIEIRLGGTDDIDKLSKDQNALKALIAKEQARPGTAIQVRGRLGEPLNARVGLRVPIQTAVFPTATRSDGNNPRVFAAQVGFPQFTYEDVGLALESTARLLANGQLELKLNFEQTALDTSTGKLTPVFATRRVSNVIQARLGQTSVLLAVAKPDPGAAPSLQPADRPTEQTNGSFVVLLTARLVD